MSNYKENGFKKRGGGNFGGRPKFTGRGGRDNRSGGSFGGNRSGGGRPSVEMFKTECDNCHKSCEVPFKPSSGKAVFCSDCFSKKNNESDRGDRGNRDGGYGKPSRDQHQTRYDRPQTRHNELAAVQRQMEAIGAKLDRIIEILQPPVPLNTLLEKAIKAEAEEE